MELVSFKDTGTVAHEIGHVLGLDHEQSRPDRHQHIVVNQDNLTDTAVTEFTPVPGAQPLGPYDINSIMHYEQYDTSGLMAKNTKKPLYDIVPGRPGPEDPGRKQRLSDLDISAIQAIYKVG